MLYKLVVLANRGLMNLNSFISSFLLITWIFLSASASEPEIMKLIRQKYNKEASIQLQFDQKIYWGIREKTEQKSGTLILASDNRFRIEINGEFFVSNGKKFWHYSKATSQVTIENINKMDIESLPSNLLQNYLIRYSFTQKEKNGTETVLEWNKSVSDNSVYTSIIVWAGSSGVINKIQVTDRNSNINTYSFRKTIFGGKISGNPFDFKIPKNVQVLNNYD